MRLTKLDAPDFDLEKTLDSGQVFHWDRHGNGHAGAIGEQPTYVEQRDGVLLMNRDAGEYVRHYFSLDHPLAEICRSLPDDPAMRAARDFCRGLRIIRQPVWECLATFITSSMKQVAHIRQISHALRSRFGERKTLLNLELRAFPSALRLTALSEEELRQCALGYRAKTLLGTARLVSSGAADLEAWRALADDELRSRLCELPGVGAKVANCVMLFAYERLRAFPIDVWIERVLKEKYFARKRKVTAERLRSFCEAYFGEHGGYAQQYLFHHARMLGRTGNTREIPRLRCASARNDKQGKARRGGVARPSAKPSRSVRLSLGETCDTVVEVHKPARAKEPPVRCTLRDSRATPS